MARPQARHRIPRRAGAGRRRGAERGEENRDQQGGEGAHRGGNTLHAPGAARKPGRNPGARPPWGEFHRSPRPPG